MAVLVLFVLFLGLTGHSTANWCVCKDGPDTVLQKTLDYACGAGADCNPIRSNGPCFNPNTVKAHCSYAANSYFQKKGQTPGSCDFSGTASPSTTDPSTPGCSYPAIGSSSGSNTTSPTNGTPTTPVGGTPTTPVGGTPTTPTTPVSANPGTTTPNTGTPSTTTPNIGTPSTTTPNIGTPSTMTPPSGTGVLGGVGNGLGPSGSGMPNTDYSHGGLRLRNSAFLSFFTTLFFSGYRLFWA